MSPQQGWTFIRNTSEKEVTTMKAVDEWAFIGYREGKEEWVIGTVKT